MSKCKFSKQKRLSKWEAVLSFRDSDFEFLSDFDIRISSL